MTTCLGKNTVILRLPRADEEHEFLRAHRATSPEVPNFLHYYTEGMPFTTYLDVLAERARGEHLPPHHVPSTFLFAFVEARIVGRVSIRHSLNDFLERAGGHIGYVVVPEFRRRGYATTMLRQAMDLIDDPVRPGGWYYTDPQILQGQGASSVIVAQLIAGAGIGNRLLSFRTRRASITPSDAWRLIANMMTASIAASHRTVTITRRPRRG